MCIKDTITNTTNASIKTPNSTLIPFILWNTWLNRNSNLFYHTTSITFQTKIKTQVAEFISIAQITANPKPKFHIPIRWHPPTNHYKLNIDRAYDQNNQNSGTGVIIKDHNI